MRSFLTLLAFAVVSQITMAQDATVGQFADWLIGTYNKLQPAETVDEFVKEKVVITQIWDDAEDIWLYVERFANSDKKNPSVQEIWRIDQDGTNKFSIIRSDFPDKEHFIGAYKKTSEFKLLDRKELRRRKGCELRILFAKDTFLGNNLEPCDPISKDAAIETFDLELSNGTLLLQVQWWTDMGEYISGPKDKAETFIKKT